MKFFRFSMMLLTGALLMNSCVKQSYDSPPTTADYDPNLAVHTSVKQLRDTILNWPYGKWRKMGDTIISGTVISSDFTGNFYKNLVIEDSSKGGIVIYIEQSYIYADYPVGRKIYLKLKDLCITNYKGLAEIVFSVDSLGNTVGIPSGMLSQFIVKGPYPRPVTPEEVTIIDVKSNPFKYMSTLVKIKDVQFQTGSAGVPYAGPSSSSSGTSRTIENCSHTASAVMYNSAYATFQPYLTPTKNGDLTCIVSEYYAGLQLLIRDTADVAFTKDRCP